MVAFSWFDLLYQWMCKIIMVPYPSHTLAFISYMCCVAEGMRWGNEKVIAGL